MKIFNRIAKANSSTIFSLLLTFALLLSASVLDEYLRREDKVYLLEIILFLAGATSFLVLDSLSRKMEYARYEYLVKMKRQLLITKLEEHRQIAIEEAKIRKMKLIAEAEGKKRASIEEAEGTVQTIRLISDILKRQPNSSMLLQYLIAQKYVTANLELSKSSNSKVIFMDPKALTETIGDLISADQTALTARSSTSIEDDLEYE